MGILYLGFAIIAEVFGTTMMKLSAVTKNKLSIIGVILGYLIAFYLLSIALRAIPISFAYAAWSGLGTALTAAVGFIFFKEKVERQTIIGIALLIVGLVLIRL